MTFSWAVWFRNRGSSTCWHRRDMGRYYSTSVRAKTAKFFLLKLIKQHEIATKIIIILAIYILGILLLGPYSKIIRTTLPVSCCCTIFLFAFIINKLLAFSLAALGSYLCWGKWFYSSSITIKYCGPITFVHPDCPMWSCHLSQHDSFYFLIIIIKVFRMHLSPHLIRP